MSKCKKVKNPCKICLRAVTHKNGLQCQGACECWVHYACLNYTPGKIKDIKAGIIKVTCPCPDCKSTLPKEFRTDESYSCSNVQCPANHPPNCGNAACPINMDVDKTNQIPQILCPLGKCGAECKTNSHPNIPDSPALPKAEPCVSQNVAKSEYAQVSQSASEAYLRPGKCQAFRASSHYSGDYTQYPEDGLPSLGALEQMCRTVGQLTNQINCLMHKMTQVVQARSGGGCDRHGCSQKGPKSMCPKPCYCPGNPGKRS